MKRIAIFLLALIMSLLLIACSSSEAETKEEKQFDPIGVWTCSYEAKEGDSWGTQKGDVITWTFDLFDGGTGKFTTKNSRSSLRNSEFLTTWEMKGDVINISYSSVIMGFKVNYDEDTLTSVEDDSKVLIRQP